jgi:hypothetical protein
LLEETNRETDRQRESERQRETEREREKQRETERDRDRETGRETETERVTALPEISQSWSSASSSRSPNCRSMKSKESERRRENGGSLFLLPKWKS